MPRYIDTNILKAKILEERDKIALTVVERYSFGTPVASTVGGAMRGGIRKALRCMEQTPTADVVPREEVERLERIRADLSREIDDLKELVYTARSEVIKEFADRLKKKVLKLTEYDDGGWDRTVYAVDVIEIDTLIKEMTEGSTDGR